jgi:hypothetical protein
MFLELISLRNQQVTPTFIKSQTDQLKYNFLINDVNRFFFVLENETTKSKKEKNAKIILFALEIL